MRAAIDQLIQRGRLIHRPSAMLDISARDVFLTPEIDALARRPFADTEEGERHAELAAYLDAFAELNVISVSEDPDRKPWDVALARVKPVEADFWSMRITEPEGTAGMRLLGAFCWLDGFVALACEYREHIPRGSFHEEVEEARRKWTDYFGDKAPHTGASVDEYLTNYYRA
jgi:hypothetical protein